MYWYSCVCKSQGTAECSEPQPHHLSAVLTTLLSTAPGQWLGLGKNQPSFFRYLFSYGLCSSLCRWGSEGNWRPAEVSLECPSGIASAEHLVPTGLFPVSSLKFPLKYKSLTDGSPVCRNTIICCISRSVLTCSACEEYFGIVLNYSLDCLQNYDLEQWINSWEIA